MELILNRVGKIFGTSEAADVYWIAKTDSYIFISDRGIECKIQQLADGKYVLVLLCLENNHMDSGQEPEMIFESFASQEEIKTHLQQSGCYIVWGDGDCFSTTAFKFNTPGKIMSGKYKGQSCIIEDDNGQYSLIIYKNGNEDCEEVRFFDGIEDLKNKLDFVIEFHCP